MILTGWLYYMKRVFGTILKSIQEAYCAVDYDYDYILLLL